ncbi:MmyB family transcriptional regulator [Nocardia tengchongensis]
MGQRGPRDTRPRHQNPVTAHCASRSPGRVTARLDWFCSDTPLSVYPNVSTTEPSRIHRRRPTPADSIVAGDGSPREAVDRLRMAAARTPGDSRLTQLVGELSVHDPDFRRWVSWSWIGKCRRRSR